MSPPVLAAEDVVVRFPIRSGLLFRRVAAYVHALDGVSLTLRDRETLAVVGESGCGKSTLGRVLAGVIRPTSGSVLVQGTDLATVPPRKMKPVRRRLQMIFQDPYSSLNPRRTLRQLVTEAWEIHRDLVPKSAQEERFRELLELVGLNPVFADRYPHQFSGGQQQRISIARALSVEPEILVCDEPLSALDVTMQEQIVELLRRLQRELGLSYVFVSHDLSLVRDFADRVAVMYLGRIVEQGEPKDLFDNPRHPYTQALVAAIPEADPAARKRKRRIVLEGDVPSPINPPSGCSFRTRCWMAEEVCTDVEPPLREVGGRLCACHFA